MELSQTLQDLLSSDKFNNSPEDVSTTTTTTTTTTPNQEQSRYDECNRLYILGEFIELFQLLQKYNKLDGNFKEKEEVSEKWNLLLFKGVISMDDDTFSALNTESTVGNSISHCLTSKFDQIINTRHMTDDKLHSGEEEYTIEYVFGLIQSYYLFNLKHNNNNNNNNNKTISSSKNYTLLKKFTNKVLNYLKYLPHTCLVDPLGKDNKVLFDKFQYNVFQLVDFYVFELEINALHKVKNIQLYESLSSCKVYSYIKDTKYEENITKRLSFSPTTIPTSTTTHTTHKTNSQKSTPKSIEQNTTSLTSIFNHLKNNTSRCNSSFTRLYSKYYNSENITIKTLSIIIPSSITLLMVISFFIKLRSIIKRRRRANSPITTGITSTGTSTSSNSVGSIYRILSRLYNTL